MAYSNIPLNEISSRNTKDDFKTAIRLGYVSNKGLPSSLIMANFQTTIRFR